MSSLSAKCGGGGWTLVMKLDGDKVKHVIFNSIQDLVFSPDSHGILNKLECHSESIILNLIIN